MGIAAAAFGAHGLDKITSAEGVRWWAIGAALHLMTVPVVLVVALFPGQVRASAGWTLLGGIAVFSGSLYAMALGAPRFLGAVTPLGGLLLIVGWALIAFPREEPPAQ
jgi:uncharacterized membrane protein YgdD (TMEM256/DUF423 family)